MTVSLLKAIDPALLWYAMYSLLALFISATVSSYAKIAIKGMGDTASAKTTPKGQDETKRVEEESLPRNLLKNNCGQDGFLHWDVLSSGGDGWTVEETPVGIEGMPVVTKEGIPISDFEGRSSCFATSYGLSEKRQLVDLVKEGLSEYTLDSMQPTIEVSEWFACRIVCDSIYTLSVKLLDKEKKCLSKFEVTKDFVTSPKESWQKVSHAFQKYGPGARFVEFCHGGGDSRKLPGHYGCKISGGLVRVLHVKEAT